MPPPNPRNAYYGVLLVAAAYFMENLDGTIIATALPHMARSFHARAVDLNIGMTAYLLAVAIFIPVSGWIADRIGTRTTFAWAIAVFTFASVLCGTANSIVSFTTARTLQGIAGAMMVPVGRLVVLRTTQKEDLLRAIAYITWPGLVAPILAPPLGGWISDTVSWRWIFFLNIPLGIAALVLTFFFIRNDRDEVRRKFDWLTFALSAAACSSFVSSIEVVGQSRPNYFAAAALLAGSLLAGVLAIVATRHSRAPLFDLASLKLRSFAVTIFGGSLFRIAISVAPFLLPLMFQMAFGLSAFRSGLLLLALFAGNLGMKPMTSYLLRRFGFRNVLIVNGLCVFVATALCSTLSPAMPVAMLVTILVGNGMCRSMQFTSLNTLAFADVEPARMSAANSLQGTVQQLTMGMGVAVGALALRLAEKFHGRGGSPPKLQDFQMAFVLVSGLALISVADYLSLPRTAGEVATVRKQKTVESPR
jgi:EmrB/QacA subfamily drug resistance transporter